MTPSRGDGRVEILKGLVIVSCLVVAAAVTCILSSVLFAGSSTNELIRSGYWCLFAHWAALGIGGFLAARIQSRNGFLRASLMIGLAYGFLLAIYWVASRFAVVDIYVPALLESAPIDLLIGVSGAGIGQQK